jgi:hypothetical protein
VNNSHVEPRENFHVGIRHFGIRHRERNNGESCRVLSIKFIELIEELEGFKREVRLFEGMAKEH